MTPARRSALYGAAIGAIAGIIRSAFDVPITGSHYAPQTEAGRIVGEIAYALPWAAIGALIGGALGKLQRGVTSQSGLAGFGTSPPPTTAMQRLGHVFGWTGNVIAIPLACLAIYGLAQPEGVLFIKISILVAAVLFFLLGRALRYIFAGLDR